MISYIDLFGEQSLRGKNTSGTTATFGWTVPEAYDIRVTKVSSTAKTLFNYNYQNTDTVPLKKSYIDFSKSDDLDKFIEALKKFFRRFPFSLNNMNEKHYHSILYTVLTSFGADISANQETALGKSDLILKMPKTVYVIELKYDRSVESALAQIDDRDYTAAVLDDKKRIVKLAIKFSEKDRNIVDYKAVEVKN